MVRWVEITEFCYEIDRVLKLISFWNTSVEQKEVTPKSTPVKVLPTKCTDFSTNYWQSGPLVNYNIDVERYLYGRKRGLNLRFKVIVHKELSSSSSTIREFQTRGFDYFTMKTV